MQHTKLQGNPVILKKINYTPALKKWVGGRGGVIWFTSVRHSVRPSVTLFRQRFLLARPCKGVVGWCDGPWETRGWSGGAMVLGELPVPGRPTSYGKSRSRAYCACSRCGWGLFGHFYSHLSFLLSFSLSLGDDLI